MDIKIDSILEDNEKINWQGKVNRKVLIFTLIVSLLVVFTLGGFLFTKETIHYTQDNNGLKVPKEIAGSTVGLAIIILGLFLFLWLFFSDLVKDYALTPKRIIIKSGIIGTDFESTYYNEIKNIVVDVGLIGKIFSVGTVKIDIGEIEVTSTGGNSKQSASVHSRVKYRVLKHIDNPYEVYKNLQGNLTNRVEGLYSGRADRESNSHLYEKQ